MLLRTAPLLLATLIGALLTSMPPLAMASGTPVTTRQSLPGNGSWDYLSIDSARGHLFVTHGDQVQVIDTSTGKPIGNITQLKGAHGVAVASDLQRGFISNGKGDAVTVFDLETFKTLATIADAGKNPDAIVYDPKSHHVLTFDGHSDSDRATVIDGRSHKVLTHIALPGTPEFAVADGRGHVYVNIESRSELSQINTATNRVTRTWALAGCESPSGLALDTKHRRLFSVCGNQTMAVSDADAGKVVATVAIGKGPDAVVFDPATAMIYSANGESGDISVVHEDAPNRYSVKPDIATQHSARTLTLDTDRQRLYLSAGSFAPGRTAQGRRKIAPGSFTLLTVVLAH